MKIKIEFDLDNIYADEFIPIFNQPILKVIRDIKRVQDLIVDKVSEDVRSSENFRKMTYAQLSEEIDAWAIRDCDDCKFSIISSDDIPPNL